jgi:hypothetical protein
MNRTIHTTAFLMAAGLAACGGPPTVRVPVIPAPVTQAGAPGEEGRTMTVGEVAGMPTPRHVAADVRRWR